MWKKLLAVVLVLLVASSLFIACKITPNATSTTSKPAQTPQVITTSKLSATAANWWDKFGEPKYGGTMSLQTNMFPTNFDPYSFFGLMNYVYEPLIAHDWKYDRSKFGFTGSWAPESYWQGDLAESWEWPDPQTMIVHLHHGVHWQDKAPVNGREFTADDVVFHYDRLLGTGHGYSQPAPTYAQWATTFDKVTATDKYTAVIKFKKPSVINNHWTMLEVIMQMFEAPEWAELGGPPATPEAGGGGPPAGGGPPGPGGPPAGIIATGPLQEWQNATGTGAFILTDYVSGSSLTLTKNANYWNHDERHSQNKLPYLDIITMLNIPDTATAMAALRTGKIDMMSSVNWQQAGSINKSNPELAQIKVSASGLQLQLRVDHSPFTDINVRKALQMSLDLPSIAKNYFNGIVDGKPVGLVSPEYAGYAIPFDKWPQSVKDDYTYNPEGAKKLLADAGYPNGFDTNVVTATTMDLQLLQVIQSYFKGINVNLEIRPMDSAAEQAYVNAFKHDQMCCFTSTAGLPPYISVTNWLAKGNTWTRHGDSNFDATVDKFLAAPNEDQAQKLLADADMYFVEHHWTVETFPSATFTIWQPYLKGYSGESGGMSLGSFYWSRLWIDK
jgi:peptide/nickel transport system substrate-binding protein